jgi:transposase-like protein
VGVVPNTLRGWCKQRDIDEGRKPGLMTVDTARIKELERANRGLKRTNEMAGSSGGRNVL